MSVLVKGMKMPKGCVSDEPPYRCPFCDLLMCTRLNYRYAAQRAGTRLPDCPLVDVPTPHGRLIDVDCVDESAFEPLDYLSRWDAGMAMSEIYTSAPTVIPAEEDE